MTGIMQLSVARDFSTMPALRHCKDSDESGEDFYHAVLNKRFKVALESNSKLLVDLDDTNGYASSFLDEAFGNLVYDFTLAKVKAFLELKSDQQSQWISMITDETFRQWENRRKRNEAPKVTKVHPPWFRFVDEKIDEQVWQTPVNV